VEYKIQSQNKTFYLGVAQCHQLTVVTYNCMIKKLQLAYTQTTFAIVNN